LKHPEKFIDRLVWLLIPEVMKTVGLMRCLDFTVITGMHRKYCSKPYTILEGIWSNLLPKEYHGC